MITKTKYNGGALGKPRDLPVLVDVDGVCAEFIKKACSIIEDIHGTKIDPSKVFTEIREMAGSSWDEQVEERIAEEGFAYSLDEIPNSISGIKDIMKNNEVMFLTSPYPNSRHWFMDRFLWLKDRFDIDRDDIIFARDKRYVNGKIFIDDRWENILDWSAQNKKPAILFKQPWNLKNRKKYRDKQVDKDVFMFKHNDGIAQFTATDDWDKILNLINESF